MQHGVDHSSQHRTTHTITKTNNTYHNNAQKHDNKTNEPKAKTRKGEKIWKRKKKKGKK